MAWTEVLSPLTMPELLWVTLARELSSWGGGQEALLTVLSELPYLPWHPSHPSQTQGIRRGSRGEDRFDSILQVGPGLLQSDEDLSRLHSALASLHLMLVGLTLEGTDGLVTDDRFPTLSVYCVVEWEDVAEGMPKLRVVITLWLL